jgi:hypothetical protein
VSKTRYVCDACGRSYFDRRSWAPFWCECGNRVEAPPGEPSVVRTAPRYAFAVAEHLLLGRKTRTDEEVERLYVLCRQCEYFRDGVCRHRRCGCRVSRDEGEFRNKLRMQTQRCPIDAWRTGVQVLINSNVASPMWRHLKIGWPLKLLADNGVEAAAYKFAGQSGEELAKDVERFGARLFVNQAMLIAPAVMEQAATLRPDVLWATTIHSSQSDLARNRAWLNLQSVFADIAREHRNCWVGFMDERMAEWNPFGLSRSFAWRGCVPVREESPVVELDPPVVSLACQERPLKNLPNQLVGAALASKQVPLRVIATLGDEDGGGLQSLASSLGLDVTWRRWMDWPEYDAMVRDDVSIGLQVSFTESFNYVALEHLLHGKPVIASPAVRYVPAPWKASPDDPQDIARRILLVLGQLKHNSETARFVGAKKAESNNVLFVETVKGLLEEASCVGKSAS